MTIRLVQLFKFHLFGWRYFPQLLPTLRSKGEEDLRVQGNSKNPDVSLEKKNKGTETGETED